MPAKSQAQQRLMAAAEHGADFKMARDVRKSMSLSQMRDFATGSMASKPAHVKHEPIHNLKHFAHPKKSR